MRVAEGTVKGYEMGVSRLRPEAPDRRPEAPDRRFGATGKEGADSGVHHVKKPRRWGPDAGMLGKSSAAIVLVRQWTFPAHLRDSKRLAGL